jgi:hypothetical protein
MISALITLAMASAIAGVPQGAGAVNQCFSGHLGTDNKVAAHKDALSAATADVVANNRVDRYTVKLPAGLTHVVVTSPGDVDLNVCKKVRTKVRTKVGKKVRTKVRTDWKKVCESTNPPPMSDACGAEGLSGWPGVGEYVVGPGTFRIEVLHCLSVECGIPETPAPLPYVLTWFTV